MLLPKKLLTRKDEIAADFLRLVDEHVNDLLNERADKRYGAGDFAKLLFIHPRHLTNTIKLVTGKSPCDFMEERIIAEAQKMLKNTELSIADISYKVGYRDPTNFTKFFKGMTGMPPLQYRKKLTTSVVNI